jgi:hypothetical protein
VTAARTRDGRLARLLEIWSRLHIEQRVAAIAATLLIVSTLGPFSFVEAAEILAAGAVLVLLKQRAEGRAFHLPFGDGPAIFAAGIWCGVLIATRIFDRPPGMTVLALVCALLLAAAGLRERAKRAPDDLPEELVARRPERSGAAGAGAAPAMPVQAAPPARSAPAQSAASAAAKSVERRRPRPKAPGPEPDATRQLSLDEDVTISDEAAEPPSEPERQAPPAEPKR